MFTGLLMLLVSKNQSPQIALWTLLMWFLRVVASLAFDFAAIGGEYIMDGAWIWIAISLFFSAVYAMFLVFGALLPLFPLVLPRILTVCPSRLDRLPQAQGVPQRWRDWSGCTVHRCWWRPQLREPTVFATTPVRPTATVRPAATVRPTTVRPAGAVCAACRVRPRPAQGVEHPEPIA